MGIAKDNFTSWQILEEEVEKAITVAKKGFKDGENQHEVFTLLCQEFGVDIANVAMEEILDEAETKGLEAWDSRRAEE